MRIVSKCRKCINYKISWDKNFPYSCEALGFKTIKNPYLVVYETSGIECMFFKPKEIKRDKEDS